MGVVYRAYDSVMRRDVAVKTLRDVPSGSFLELFSRECSVLAAMVHPNVVEIFDMGEFDDGGISKPYFVMPLLPGNTLHDLIYPAGTPVPPQRAVDIIAQACRGLQAAHERELIHQDIKPRNIFVMRDDAVKIIDFGVAHLGGGNSTGIRGTPQYMSPEQITFKGVTFKSDIFSLAVVCYEALTATHPFLRKRDRRDTQSEIAEAITAYIPPLASEVNPSVSRAVAQVVAKGMAKDVWNRYESAAAFADALQRALRNENPGADRAIVRARLDRARKSFAQNDLQFASEIVSQLEAEGHSDPDIADLRKILDDAVQRERSGQLLAAAERCFDGEEYTLALRKIQEVLDIDSSNTAALSLKRRIDNIFAERKITELLDVANSHLSHAAFANARQSVLDALKLRPSDTRARHLLDEIDTRQKEVLRQRQEKERLYQAAQAAFFSGNIETALENLEQLSRLNTPASETRERAADYRELYGRVRAEYDNLKTALAQAESLLDHDLTAAQKICDRYLAKYSGQADFTALSKEIVRRREEAAQAFRYHTMARAEAEDDLDARLQILQEAKRNRPGDAFFQTEINKTRDLSRKTNELADSARALERKGDFAKAIDEWENVRSVYARYPALDGEVERLRAAVERQRTERKLALFGKIEDALEHGAHDVLPPLLKDAESQYAGDAQLATLRARADEQIQKVRDVEALLNRARQANKRKRYGDIARSLTEAADAAAGVPVLRHSVFEESVAQADSIAASDWRTAKDILSGADRIAPDLSVPARSWQNARALERNENVDDALKKAADAEASGNLAGAQSLLAEAIEQYPGEARLESKMAAIDNAVAEKRRKEERERALANLRSLQGELSGVDQLDGLRNLNARAMSIAEPYTRDAEFLPIVSRIGEHTSAYETALGHLTQGNAGESLRVSNEMLTSYPDSRLFQNLKAQAEDRQRQDAADYLEQVANRLAHEPDLAARGALLEEALRRYPNEPYFADELTLVRNEQALIARVSKRAEDLEKEGYPAEASEQWAYLKSHYPNHPGVDDAIERCHESIRKQRETARNASVAEVEEALRKRDYAAALARAAEAHAEFPEDQELANLERVATGRSELKASALGLLKRGDSSFERGDYETGRELLRQSLAAAQYEPEIAQAIAASLLQHAATAIDIHLPHAEAMIADAKAVDPNLEVPRALQTALDDARARFDFEEFRAEVEPLEANRQFTQALELSAGFLNRYPRKPEALAIHNRLSKAREAAEAKRRREESLAQLQEIDDRAKAAAHANDLLNLVEQTQAVARRNPADQEVAAAANQLATLLKTQAQVRTFMEDGRLPEAAEACERAAAAFPGAAIFEHLHGEIVVRQNERAAAYLRQVEQALANENDFEKQERILLEAVQQYPNEIYFADELQLVRNKKSLLAAEIARARDLESKELFEDALNHWQSLRKKYYWYPGIDDEIARVRQTWQQRVTAIRNAWLGKLHKSLSVADIDAAESTLAEARSELAGDPVLSELEAQIERARQSQDERHQLMLKGNAALKKGEFQNGAAALTSAAHIFEGDTAFREIARGLLLTEAEANAQGNWPGAETLIGAIRQIDPSFKIPDALVNVIAQKKRERELALLLEQAVAAEAAGNFREAKRLLDGGASKFPESEALNQKRAAIAEKLRQIALQEAREEAQRQTAEVRAALAASNGKRQLTKLRAGYVSKGLLDSSDAQIKSQATALLAEIDAKLADLQTAAPGTGSGLLRFWYIPLLVIVAAVAIYMGLRPKPMAPPPIETTKSEEPVKPVEPPPPATGSLTVRMNVDDATVFIDGRRYNTNGERSPRILLPAGTYNIYATRDGYTQSDTERITLNGGSSEIVNLRLTAKPAKPEAPVTPAVPNAVAREANEWNSVKGGNVADLQAFQSRHPNGPHYQAAAERIAQLEQAVKADRDRQETNEWNALDRNNKDALQAFANKYPNGSHAAGARQLLSDIAKAEKQREDQNADEAAWSAVDHRQRASIEGYLSRYPAGRHAAQAQQALESLNQPPPAPRQPAQNESAGVLATLQRFVAAWEDKNIPAIVSLQPSLNQRTLKATLAPVKAWRMSLTPLSTPQVSGDRATVTCRRRVTQTFADGTERSAPETKVTYTLRKQGAGWIIEDAQ